MSEMTFDRIYGLALMAFGLLAWYLFHLLHRADAEVEASVTRALGPVVPLDDLMHEQASAEAYDDLPEEPAAKAAAKFTRAGWIEYAPGCWVKGTPEALALIGSVCADLDDLLLTSEEDAR